MTSGDPPSRPAGREARPFMVRLPGFAPDEPVGLGQAIKRATSMVGVKPCAGCVERAAALDHRVVIDRWRR